jgi:hypothetical protein
MQALPLAAGSIKGVAGMRVCHAGAVVYVCAIVGLEHQGLPHSNCPSSNLGPAWQQFWVQHNSSLMPAWCTNQLTDSIMLMMMPQQRSMACCAGMFLHASMSTGLPLWQHEVSLDVVCCPLLLLPLPPQVPVWWCQQVTAGQTAAAGTAADHRNTGAPLGLCQLRRGKPQQGERYAVLCCPAADFDCCCASCFSAIMSCCTEQ